MERANDVIARQHAIGQRRAAVRTAVLARMHAAAARAEDGDSRAADLEGPTQPRGDLLLGAKANVDRSLR
jgi:hypothetical protein